MLIGVYTDPHFTQYSNIIASENGDYTGRLENLIKSFQWADMIFKENKVNMIFCLGDLTDRNNLTAEEISAINQCHLENHHFIVGNHCRSDKDGHYNTLNMFNNVYNTPEYLQLNDGTLLFILPYSSQLIDLNDLDPTPDIILSHNDIADYDFGEYISKGGYKIADILSNSKLFINGHLHRGEWLIKNRVMNLGSISGINFATLEGEWNPSVGIINTDTMNITLYENPYSLKFRKKTIKNLLELNNYVSNLKSSNYVVQFKVPQRIITDVRNILNDDSIKNKIIASRIITYSDSDSFTFVKQEQVNHSKLSHYDLLREHIQNKKPNDYDMNIFNDIIDQLMNV